MQKGDAGNYLLFGTTDWDDGDVSFNNGTSDYWLCNLDISGNIIRERSAGGSNFEFFSYGILSSSNKIILCGNSDSPNSGDVSGYHGGIGGDLWLVSFSDFLTSTEENLVSAEAIIYPNPFNEKLFVELKKAEGFFHVGIIDLFGNTVFSLEETGTSFEMDLSFLQSGLYEMNIYNNKINKTFKVVKQ